jgi:twitching motility two-component system response regulator PilG
MISSYPPPSHLHSRFLIVVIGDSATVRKILKTCLWREDFTVRAFPDGIEAMQWLASPQGRVPDLIILDLILLKMNGYQIARQMSG